MDQPMTDWIPCPTQDGSFTFFSAAFNETFHSRQGARTEAIEKFAIATHLPRLAQQAQATGSPIKLLDICYGLGLNTAAALETLWQIAPHCPVELYALELDASVPLAAIAPELIQTWSPPVQAALQALARHQAFPGLNARSNARPNGPSTTDPTNQDPPGATIPLTAQLLIGDARQTIAQVQAAHFQADAIFFDPFSPRRCPQLWTIDFFRQVAQCLAPSGRLATYSRAASVRSAMLATGFQLGTLPLAHPHPSHPHEWAQGTIAVRPGNTTELVPLSPMEQEHLQTRAGIALRDPSLRDESATILERQRLAQAATDLESTSSWRRRWGLG